MFVEEYFKLAKFRYIFNRGQTIFYGSKTSSNQATLEGVLEVGEEGEVGED